MNSEARPRAPMDPALRHRLLDEFTPEIERLGRLIDRDLSAWLESEGDVPGSDFKEHLLAMPNVGSDEDFERIYDLPREVHF